MSLPKRTYLSDSGIDLGSLRIFLLVARAGQITEAAKSLDVPQPTVTRHLQRLERDFGAKLVIRTSKGVSLTQAGSTLLLRVSQMFAALDSARGEILEIQKGLGGLVRLGTIVSVGSYVLPEILGELNKRYPLLDLRLTEGTSEDLTRLIEHGDLDLAVVVPPLPRASLRYERLWLEDYVLVVPSKHPLAQRHASVFLTDVVNERFAFPPGRHAFSALVEACRQNGIEPKVLLESDNLESVRRLVAGGYAVAILPTFVPEVGKWNLPILRIAAKELQREVGVLHRAESPLTRRIAAVRDALLTFGAVHRESFRASNR